MKTELRVPIFCDDEQTVFETMVLRLDLSFAPAPSLKFSAPPWDDEQLPESVTYDVEKSAFFVQFADDHVSTKRQALQRMEEFRRHHWLPLGVDQRAETIAWVGPPSD